MNLDLDERIIPNGEYREALNVQVSTSENSDVGSVQNILGNTLRNAGISSVPADAFCVGQIADEKNNKLYYIIQGTSSGIIEYDITTNTNQIILVDSDNSVLKLSGSFITGINIIDDFLFFTDGENEPKKINIKQFEKNSHSDFSTTSNFYVNGVSQGTVLEEHITVIKRKPEHPLKVELVGTNDASTSGFTEPVLITTADVYSATNTTTLTITVELETFNDTNYPAPVTLINGTTIPAASGISNAVTYKNGIGLDIHPGDILLLADPNIAGALPSNTQIRAKVVAQPNYIGNQVAPGLITAWHVEYTVQILSVDSSTPAIDTIYEFQLENLSDILFDKDFPRFGYRYKYQDGEYSAFSPFTQAAFLPSIYNIHPTREPYNTGMQNTVKQINLTEFVTNDIPEGVVEIDLLYKADSTPAIYSIDTIKPTFSTPFGPANNPKWHGIDGSTNNTTINLINTSTTASNTGYYSITSDTIYGILPENQLLRPFDNVPKKAKAQDFTAGRLIYGNYTQNLDISFDKAIELLVEFEDRKIQNINDDGKRSIKSLRDYQLGVVYTDAYGRETPIFTGGDRSTKKLPFNLNVGGNFKGAASSANSIVASEIPIPEAGDAKFLKFYIKETASEYYNLVLDRVYRAEEDGNLWLSFPSSDRNKLQEGDFIILKKALESDQQVDLDNKFKVIDIKNESPEFIRKKYRQLGKVDGDGVLGDLYTNTILQPRPLFDKLALDKAQLLEEDVQDIQILFDQKKKIYIKFEATASGGGLIKSQRYKIISLEVSGPEYTITFDKPIAASDSWIESSSGTLEPTLKTILLLEEKEQWEEFQGRFFVKILSDIVTDEFLESQIGASISVQNTAVFNVFSLRDAVGNSTTDGLWSWNTSLSDATSSNTPGTFSDVSGDWTGPNGVLTFGTGDTSSGWFIDQVHMAAQQPTVDPYANGNTNHGYKTTPNGSSSLGYNFDVSLSGNLFKAGITSPATTIDWVTQGNYINHPNGDADNGTSAKDFNKINSLDGVITSTALHALSASGGSGAKAWKKHLGNWGSVGEQVYGLPGETGKIFMHLSFSAVGEDLYLSNSPVNSVVNYSSGRYVPTYGGDRWAFDSSGAAGINTIDLQSIDNHNNQKADRDKVCDIAQIASTSSFMYDIDKIENQWNPAFNNPANQNIIDNLIQGNKFKISTDADSDRVFTIKSVTKKRIYNHTSWNRRVVFNAATQSWIEDKTSVHYAWWDLKLNAKTGDTKIQELTDALVNFGAAHNRRVCYILELDQNAGDDAIVDSGVEGLNFDASTVFSIQQTYVDENSTVLSDNPAVFETEPTQDEGLDIYYEASGSIPIDISTVGNKHMESIIPIGTKVEVDATYTGFTTPIQDNVGCVVSGWDGNTVELDPGLSTASSISYAGAKIRFVNKDGSYIQSAIANVTSVGVSGFYNNIVLDSVVEKVSLPYYNCFSFANGVESNRIRDDFNKPFIKNGVKASTTLKEQYLEDHRSSGLIYSGLYNKNTSLNELNQFRMAESITKELDPTYGTIQKLFARNSDLISFCEDKVVQIAADKDIIFNADGNPQLVASNKVLGQSRPFVGEYGISKNPESFASSSYRAYFTDKQRGAVLRLSMDGLTPISDAGMKDWFRDKFKNLDYSGQSVDYLSIVGSYDSNKDTYNLTFDTNNDFVQEATHSTGPRQEDFISDVDYRHDNSVTVSYKEDVKGWVSFRSFIQEGGLTLNNTYFTFREGQPYSHDNETRNNFYNATSPSFITAVFNDIPTSVKNFNTLNYSGNLGWQVDSIETDIESGNSSPFVTKENKHFSHIYNDNEANDTSSFSFQGIGTADNIEI